MAEGMQTRYRAHEESIASIRQELREQAERLSSLEHLPQKCDEMQQSISELRSELRQVLVRIERQTLPSTNSASICIPSSHLRRPSTEISQFCPISSLPEKTKEFHELQTAVPVTPIDSYRHPYELQTNVSGGCLQTATDPSKASVTVPDPTLQGLNDSDLTSLVVDHTSDAVSHNKGKPPLLSADAFVHPDAKLENKKSEAPVLFRGMAPLLHPVNNLEMKILPVPSSANSANLNPKSLETSYQDVFLEAVVLAQLVENVASNVSLARVPQTSSLDNEDIEGTDGGEEKHGTVFLDPEPQAIDVWPKKQQQFDGNGQELNPLDDIDLVNGSGDLCTADQKTERSAVYDFLYPSKELLPADKEMSIFDHLEELRQRAFVSILAVGAMILGCYAFSKELIMLLESPVKEQGVRYLQLAPGEFFFHNFKGIRIWWPSSGEPCYSLRDHSLCSSWSNWSREKGPWAYSSRLLGVFYAEIVFSYYILTPAALNFFINYPEGVVESLGSIDQYFESLLVLIFSTGLSFQVPVIQLLLGQTGLVTADQRPSIRRYVVVGAVVAAAVHPQLYYCYITASLFSPKNSSLWKSLENVSLSDVNHLVLSAAVSCVEIGSNFDVWNSNVLDLDVELSAGKIVRWGYCWEDQELQLVYALIQQGGLENPLLGRGSAVQPLLWNLGLKIAIGAARGFAFLHTLDGRVTDRDIQTSNPLLGGTYNAKISDFGLAKLGPSVSPSYVPMRVMSTEGYAALEYVSTGQRVELRQMQTTMGPGKILSALDPDALEFYLRV